MDKIHNKPKFESNWTQTVESFEELNLKPELLRSIKFYLSLNFFFTFVSTNLQLLY